MRISDWSSDVCSFDLAVLQCACLPDQQFSRLDLRGHIGQFEGNTLKASNRLTELMAFLRVINGSLQRTFGHAERQGSDGNTPAIEHFHRLFEPFALFPEEVLARHPTVIKDQLRCLRSPHPQLVFLLSMRKPIRSFLNN